MLSSLHLWGDLFGDGPPVVQCEDVPEREQGVRQVVVVRHRVLPSARVDPRRARLALGAAGARHHAAHAIFDAERHGVVVAGGAAHLG